MKTSPKLPAFSGRCHVQLLPGTAAHAADTARILALLQPAEASGDAPATRFIRALLLVLLLSPLLTLLPAGIGFRAAPEAHAEHPAPASAHGWYEVDTIAELAD